MDGKNTQYISASMPYSVLDIQCGPITALVVLAALNGLINTQEPSERVTLAKTLRDEIYKAIADANYLTRV